MPARGEPATGPRGTRNAPPAAPTTRTCSGRSPNGTCSNGALRSLANTASAEPSSSAKARPTGSAISKARGRTRGRRRPGSEPGERPEGERGGRRDRHGPREGASGVRAEAGPERVALAGEGARESEQADRREDVETQQHGAVAEDHEGHRSRPAARKTSDGALGRAVRISPSAANVAARSIPSPGGPCDQTIHDEPEDDRPAEDGGDGAQGWSSFVSGRSGPGSSSPSSVRCLHVLNGSPRTPSPRDAVVTSSQRTSRPRHRGPRPGPRRASLVSLLASAMNTTDLVEKSYLRKGLPQFRPGDTVKVHVRVVEGNRERVQVFQGVVIRRSGGGLRETFTVRKISFGVGVERTFPLHSPSIAKLEIAQRGHVRRAKLYYLRDLRGKKARIKERRIDESKLAAMEAMAAEDEAIEDPVDAGSMEAIEEAETAAELDPDGDPESRRGRGGGAPAEPDTAEAEVAEEAEPDASADEAEERAEA